MFAIDIHEGIATNVGHTGAAVDLVQVAGTYGDGGTAFDITFITTAVDFSAYLDLSLHQGCRQAQQYYGKYPIHFFNFF